MDAATLEQLQKWIPSAHAPTDTFRGVDRVPPGDRRLSGIRLPLSEAESRRIAAKYRTPEPPGYDFRRIQWGLWQETIRQIDDLDATRRMIDDGCPNV